MLDFTSYGEAHLRFRSSHPISDGWIIYQFDERRCFLRYALAFLLDKYPHLLSPRSEYVVNPSEQVLDDLFQSRYAPLSTTWADNRILEGSWFGEIEATWDGKPIHIASINSFHRYGRTFLFIAAVKANSTLQKFLLALRAYVKEQRDTKHTVLVVNGTDFPRSSEMSWEDLVLPDGLADSIRHDVEGFFMNKEHYETLRVPYKRGIILAGPPGVGKTTTLRVIMGTVPATVVMLKQDTEFSKYSMEYAFSLAIQCSPSLLIFEELDHWLFDQNLSLFLNLLDGLQPVVAGVCLLCTVARAETLDPALRHRPSRFDRIYKYGLPLVQERLRYLKKKAGAMFSTEALSEVAQWTKGFTPAYLQELVTTAVMLAAHEGRQPTDDDLTRAFRTLKGQFKTVDEKTEDIRGNGDPVGFLSGGQDAL